MKYYIIAGEASGDLHGANLIAEIRKLDPNADIRCWGGDRMQEQGGNIVKHYRELAFMGFIEVIANLRTILRNIRFCKKDIQKFKPDALILIDYPGFNLRIAEFAHDEGLKVFYYISPQVWAWKKNRIKKIKKTVNKMFVILPFERDFYKQYDYDVEFVGHPLLDAIENHQFLERDAFISKNDLDGRPVITLLPGSRKQEVSTMLSVMLRMVDMFRDYQFIIGAAPSLDDSFYNKIIKKTDVKLLRGQTYNLVKNSEVALVTSGTATLETALVGTPEVVCYKGSFISYHIARYLVDVKYISLVNLIMEKEIVKELIQGNFNTKSLKNQMDALLFDSELRKIIKDEYAALREKLGGAGASRNTAREIVRQISKK